MANSPLFKRAFVRGLNTELVRTGAVVYPSKEAADYAADYIADNSGMPDPLSQGDALTQKVASALCDHLVEASQHLCKEAGDKYNPQVTKTAQATDPADLAQTSAWALMEKAAAETGSLSEGGDEPNDLAAAASTNAEAALEEQQRPENYANMGEDGVGDYEDKGKGHVGVEESHPESPQATDAGTNSAIENTQKQGALAEIIQKVAAGTGSLSHGGDTPNSLPAAAADNAEAALELNRRPENYANMGEAGVGNSTMVPDAAAQVGTEQPHPEAPAATDAGQNTATEHTKGASAFDQLFTDTAQDVVPYLPSQMAEQHKVAHVRAMMGLADGQRAAYLHDLYAQLGSEKNASLVKDHFLKTAAAKGASSNPKAPNAETEKLGEELPPALKANAEKMEEKADDDDDADEEKETIEVIGTECPMGKEASANGSSRNSLGSLRSALSNINA